MSQPLCPFITYLTPISKHAHTHTHTHTHTQKHTLSLFTPHHPIQMKKREPNRERRKSNAPVPSSKPAICFNTQTRTPPTSCALRVQFVKCAKFPTAGL